MFALPASISSCPAASSASASAFPRARDHANTTMPRRDHTSGTASSRPGGHEEDGLTRPRCGGRRTARRASMSMRNPPFSALQLVLLPLFLLVVAESTTGATAARLTTTTRRPASALRIESAAAPPPLPLSFHPARLSLPQMPDGDASPSSSSTSQDSPLPSPPPSNNNDNDESDGDDDDSSDTGGMEARGGIISHWRRSNLPLRPCFGCTPGAPMAFSNLFSDCSFVTLGAQMGIAPTFTNLTLKTNDTVLVHLVGSRFFFPAASDLYSFLTNFLDGTCPDGNRLQNLTSVCTPGGHAAPVGSDGPALCTIYSVNATKVHGLNEGEEGRKELQAHGLYGPGNYRFSFRDFNNAEFPYAFWVLQYLRIEAPGEGGRESTANVSISGQFNNQPPSVPSARLWTGMFIAALLVFVVFASVFNPFVGPRAVDLGARIPWVRRNVLEERQTGPRVQPPLSVSVAGLQQGRRMGMGSGSGSGRGLGGSGSFFYPRSMASSDDYQLLMDNAEGSSSNP